MSEQEASSRTPSATLRWWVRVCRWLWHVLRFVWGTLFVNIVVGTIANLNTTATDTPLAKLFIIHLALTYPHLVWSSLGLLAVLTLLSWLGSHTKQATPARPLSEQDRVHLLGRLRLRYEQLHKQSLEGAVQPLELGLAERPAAVQNPVSLMMRLPDQPEQLLPPNTSIMDVYTQANKELLILGEPGAGKSTLLLKLAQYLAQQAEQDAALPLPVLLPLSSWAVKPCPLDEWLSKEVTRLYDVPPRLSQQWIQAEQALPLLDGLDEMEETARGACIAAINTYHRDHLRPLVVCSRTNEYDTSTKQERLALHTAVVVQPLSPEQVDVYLASLGEPLVALRTALWKNATLQTLATTPLLLQVLMLTYHSTSVRELPRKEVQLQQQIWADYVKRMIERKGDAEQYPLDVTRKWLRWLAYEMRQHNQTIFSLESLQPTWLPARQRNLYRWSIGLIFGPVVGLAVGLVIWLVIWLVSSLTSGISIVLYVELGGQHVELGGVLRVVLDIGLVIWLLYGLVIALGGVIELVDRPVSWLVAVIQHHILRFWVWHTHAFPWKAVPFLEDATARILLRRIGRGYNFTHRLLLDYFADTYTQESSAPAAQSAQLSPP